MVYGFSNGHQLFSLCGARGWGLKVKTQERTQDKAIRILLIFRIIVQSQNMSFELCSTPPKVSSVGDFNVPVTRDGYIYNLSVVAASVRIKYIEHNKLIFWTSLRLNVITENCTIIFQQILCYCAVVVIDERSSSIIF